MKIITYPENFLSRTAKPITDINGSIQDIIDSMALTMYNAPGVGLAAIQVGIDRSIIVYDISSKDEPKSLQVLINPKIVDRQGEIISENEGCLSVPDFRAEFKRSASIIVEGLDRNRNPKKIEANDLLSIVLQHEIDHLNGILFIDRISALKKNMYKKSIKKKQSQNEYDQKK